LEREEKMKREKEEKLMQIRVNAVKNEQMRKERIQNKMK
jgi:hypothetical protein